MFTTTLPNPHVNNHRTPQPSEPAADFPFRVGQLIAFEYQTSDSDELETVTAIVTLIDDDGIMGKDLERDAERSFYSEFMRDVRPETWLQIALFEDGDEDPFWVNPRPFAPIARDRQLLDIVLQGFVDRCPRPDVTMRIVPFGTSLDSSDGSSIPAIESHVYPAAADALQQLADHNNELLAFDVDDQFTQVTAIAPEASIFIRSFEPPRPQLVKELRRVADYYRFLADRVEETEYSDVECEFTDWEEHWCALVNNDQRDSEAFATVKARA